MEATKRCPYCGEEILAVAIKCKHCGSSFGETPAPEPSKPSPGAEYGWAILGIPLAGSLLLWFWVTNMTPFQGPMAALTLIVISVVVITGAMCAFEASKLGMRSDPYWGTYSPIQWVFLVFLLWVVCYPAYLFKRRSFGVANLLAPGLLVTVIFVSSAILVGAAVDEQLADLLKSVGAFLQKAPAMIGSSSTSASPSVPAAEGPPWDWKYVAQSDNAVIFFSAASVQKLPAGRVRVWTEALPEQRTNREAGRVVEEMIEEDERQATTTGQRITRASPPISTVENMTAGDIMQAQAYETVANSWIWEQPLEQVWWEIDCPYRKIRRLAARGSVNGENVVSGEPKEWTPVFPESIGEVLYTLLCRRGPRSR
jgi:hypothetical protein